jgi:hypothetical protein
VHLGQGLLGWPIVHAAVGVHPTLDILFHHFVVDVAILVGFLSASIGERGKSGQ